MATRSVSKSRTTASRLATHEEICALRYVGLTDRISRLEKLIIGATASMLAGLTWAVWTFSTHGLLK